MSKKYIIDDIREMSAEQICDLLNKQEELIGELLYNFGELGYNNQSCEGCIYYIEDIGYCTMYDMDVKAEDIVVRCTERDVVVGCEEREPKSKW